MYISYSHSSWRVQIPGFIYWHHMSLSLDCCSHPWGYLKRFAVCIISMDMLYLCNKNIEIEKGYIKKQDICFITSSEVNKTNVKMVIG